MGFILFDYLTYSGSYRRLSASSGSTLFMTDFYILFLVYQNADKMLVKKS